MGNIIKAFQGVFAQHQDRFNRQFEREFGNLTPEEKVGGKMLPPLFRSYWLACDEDIEVVEGLTSYPGAGIEDNLLEKQSVIFGYDGHGLIGNYIIYEGDPQDVETVGGFEIQVKFQLSTINDPAEPFVQLRLSDIVDGKIVLGEVFWTIEGADLTFQMLAGGGLEMIAFKGIKGHLPEMAASK